MNIHESSILRESTVAETASVREFCTLHESEVGEHSVIYERVTLKRATVGDNSSVNTGTYLENVSVGSRVQIGPNCSLPGVWHQFNEHEVSHENVFNPITIKDGCLLGAGVTVAPGVTIGEGSVIGTGTIVTKNIPAHHICYGIPPSQTLMSIQAYLLKKR